MCSAIVSSGKEVFIKSVLQVLPTFTVSCFLLSVTFCANLKQSLNRFCENEKEVGEVCTGVIGRFCIAMLNGGLGFRDIVKFNIALLAKQGWHLISKLDSLLARSLQAKYYCSCDFMHSGLGTYPSYL